VANRCPYQAKHGLLMSFVVLLLAAVVLFALVGCGLSPVQVPESRYFAQLQPADVEMAEPAPLPPRPEARLLSTPGGEVMAFDGGTGSMLLARDEVAEANTQIAGACSVGFGELQGAYNVLLDKAQEQERYTNHVGRRWAEAETQLRRDQTAHAWENWFNRLLLAAALGLAL
jgi:hypothetical protein